MPRNRTETDYSPLSSTPTERAERVKLKRANDLTELLTAIAAKHLFVETLETRNSDSLDFRDCSVAGIKAALEAAYEAGRKASK